MSTSSGYAFLKEVLPEFEVTGKEQMATHSGKPTLLSWCSKARLSPVARRLLGGHVDPADRSIVVYSRDTLGGPLRELQALWRSVRTGRFDPDASRSGRWKDAESGDLGDQAEEECQAELDALGV